MYVIKSAQGYFNGFAFSMGKMVAQWSDYQIATMKDLDEVDIAKRDIAIGNPIEVWVLKVEFKSV